ncbi:uncharacterized protein LOC110688895 [Chenopodium quinoa]|uniref:Uncharacterized protein n=1 Tax=Chenopodium quinoa TaxID=63459 RepID=A0A803MWG5_CHEQI|nr:uncharacterized protein LOC110688895 [Chenopodium quinoa]
MTQKKMNLRPGTAAYRRKHALLQPSPSLPPNGRLAEMAGGTTAECAAVWCCCPCTLINLFVLVVYKVPASICKKALRTHRRRRMMKKGLLPLQSFAASSRASPCRYSIPLEEMRYQTDMATTLVVMDPGTCGSISSDDNNIMDKELMQLEEEMWEKFYATGFWRSPSQGEKIREQQQ